jgi:hypothetical protein
MLFASGAPGVTPPFPATSRGLHARVCRQQLQTMAAQVFELGLGLGVEGERLKVALLTGSTQVEVVALRIAVLCVRGARPAVFSNAIGGLRPGNPRKFVDGILKKATAHASRMSVPEILRVTDRQRVRLRVGGADNALAPRGVRLLCQFPHRPTSIRSSQPGLFRSNPSRAETCGDGAPPRRARAHRATPEWTARYRWPSGTRSPSRFHRS